MLLGALLVGALIDVTAHGAIADDGLSDTTAVQAAIDAAVSGDVVVFPSGTFFLTRAPAKRCAACLQSRTNITIRGAGCGQARCGGGTPTVIQGSIGALTGDYHLIGIKDGSGIVVEDMEIDGRKASITSADEQTHAIEVWNTSDVTIRDVYVHDMWGDTAKFLGDVAGSPTRFTSTDTVHVGNGRSGFAFAGGSAVTITRMYAENISDQAVDLEPASSAGIDGLTIRDSELHSLTAYALTLSGGSTPTKNVLVQNTRITGGGIHAQLLEDAEVDNATILATNGSTNGIHLQHHIKRITIRDSAILARGSFDGVALAGIEGQTPETITVKRTRITVDNGTALSYVNGPGPVTVDGISVRGHVPPTNAGTGINVQQDLATPAMAGVAMTAVDVRGVKNGIVVQRSVSAATISATFAGDVTLTTPSSVGTTCAGTVSPDRSALTVSATTANSGCP